MTGQPGDRMMGMNGKSTVSYLMRTPRAPSLMLVFIGVEAQRLVLSRGDVGSLPLCGGTF